MGFFNAISSNALECVWMPEFSIMCSALCQSEELKRKNGYQLAKLEVAFWKLE